MYIVTLIVLCSHAQTASSQSAAGNLTDTLAHVTLQLNAARGDAKAFTGAAGVANVYTKHNKMSSYIVSFLFTLLSSHLHYRRWNSKR